MRASNGKWYVRFVVDGVEYSQPTGLEATERNKRKVAQLEASARQLVLDGKAHLLRLTAIPFGEAATQFLDWAEGEYCGDSRNLIYGFVLPSAMRKSFSEKPLSVGSRRGTLTTSSPHGGRWRSRRFLSVTTCMH